MMTIPPSWPVVPLADVSQIASGCGFPRNRQGRSSGKYPLAKVGDISRAVASGSSTIGTAEHYVDDEDVKALRAKVFPTNTIVFAKIGEAIRNNYRAMTTVPLLLDNNAMGVTPDARKVDPTFLMYFLQTIDFYELTVKAIVPSIRKSDIESIEVPFPSLDEQQRIVSRIKECLSRVAEIEANEKLITPELAAVFPSILNQRFQELKGMAELATLEAAAEIRGGQSLPKGSVEDKGDQSALLVKVGDMIAEGNERTITTSRAFLPLSDVGRGLIPAEAVIFPKRGGAIATNKKRLLGRPSLLDPNLMAIVANPKVSRASFLYYWCQTLDLNDLSNGGVIPQLNRKDLAPLEIPLPGLETQDRIVAELEASESACSELQNQFQAASQDRKHLREAILRKAFAGEL